jgi:Lon protease-like protein
LTADLASSPDAVEGASASWAWCALAPLTSLDRFRLLASERHSDRLELLCELTDAVAADARGLLSGGGNGTGED